MSAYIHERQDWPKFHWNQERLAGRLATVRHRQGRLIGRMEAMGFSLRAEAVLHTLSSERPVFGNLLPLSRSMGDSG